TGTSSSPTLHESSYPTHPIQTNSSSPISMAHFYSPTFEAYSFLLRHRSSLINPPNNYFSRRPSPAAACCNWIEDMVRRIGRVRSDFRSEKKTFTSGLKKNRGGKTSILRSRLKKNCGGGEEEVGGFCVRVGEENRGLISSTIATHAVSYGETVISPSPMDCSID
ncbi:uncharacterized protein LOC127245349, partial [Andrographis paniculata]|uniref:uncharacterized protein LOC127245349 n=1 Tax=Andrographis paniculata TaxID=175694 RepID=UPI0021E9551D